MLSFLKVRRNKVQYIYLNGEMLKLDRVNLFSQSYLENVQNRLNEMFIGSDVEFTLKEPFYDSYHTVYLHNNTLPNNDLGIAETNNFFNQQQELSAQVSLSSILKDAQAIDAGVDYDEITNAVVNTVAHEASHMLGLVDNDGSQIMNGMSDETLLTPQAFDADQLDFMSQFDQDSANETSEDTNDSIEYFNDSSYGDLFGDTH